MTRVIDFPGSGDQRSVVQAALDACHEPEPVGLPTECGYVLATSSANATACAKLVQISRSMSRPVTLCLGHPGQIDDYAHTATPQARRLAYRSWPGPVVLEFEQSGHWVGPQLASSLPEVYRHQPLRLASSGHPLQVALMRELREPMAVVELPAPAGGTWASADGLELGAAWGDTVGLIVNAGFASTPQGATAVRFAPSGNWSISSRGVYSELQIAQLMAKLVVFVCTGNTCRSPLAEGLFRSLLCQRLGCEIEGLLRRGYMVSSAGVAAFPGTPANPETLRILSELGIDLSDHASQPVTEQLVRWADMILAMTARHQSAVVGAYPEGATKVELVNVGGDDIADPIGGDYTVYAECRDEIRQCLEHWLDRVISED